MNRYVSDYVLEKYEQRKFVAYHLLEFFIKNFIIKEDKVSFYNEINYEINNNDTFKKVSLLSSLYLDDLGIILKISENKIFFDKKIIEEMKVSS